MEQNNNRPKISTIISAFTSFYNVDIIRKDRRRETSIKRAMAIYIAFKCGYSSTQIGRTFYRDHTTCLAARNNINDMLDRKEKNINCQPYLPPDMVKALLEIRESPDDLIDKINIFLFTILKT